MLHVHADEVVVATGAAELQPVCPGNDLAGLVTARAAERAARRRRRPRPGGRDRDAARRRAVRRDRRRLVRFEGDADGRVSAVVTADDDDRRRDDDALRHRRSSAWAGAARRPGADGRRRVPRVRSVGAAADDPPLPPAPTEGDRLPLHGRDRRRPRRAPGTSGFTRARAAQAGQPRRPRDLPGRRLPAARPVLDRGPDRRRARARSPPGPASRQITLAEAAADVLRRRLPADAAPRRAPRARRRGWTASAAGGGRGTTATRSPSTGRSARASRSATSARSASWSSPGPDVVEVLERLYPCHVADIKPGRSRYALLLNERGHVMDDGMILREAETRFVLTFTSGGAANAEMWLRDWIETWGLRVHVLDRTMSLAAINVTGPLAEDAAGAGRPRRAAALPRPRPRRRRRRAVPRHAPVVHRRGRLRAAPPGRPVGRAVAGAHGPRRATSASGRTGSRRCSGCGSRRATSSSGWTPSSTRRRAGSGWTGRSGWTSRASSAGPRSSGPAKLPDHRRWLGFTMDGAGAGRGRADLVERRDRRAT